MDKASFFIKNRGLFGSFPSQESVIELEKNGVKYFINLTESDEKNITPYITTNICINYPIKDNYIPTDWNTFSIFIIKISKIIKTLKKDEKIYIHCRGGHSRSAIVVACLLCYIFRLSPSESLEYTTKCHSLRKIMRNRWRKLSAPQSFIQKKFVYKFFQPLKFSCSSRTNIFTYDFTIISNHIIDTELGKFSSAKYAYDEFIKNYSEKNNIDDIDENIKIKIMTNILKIKFNTYKELYFKLVNTGLRPLIQYSNTDLFWSQNNNDEGSNNLGKILMKIRNKYYENEIDF